MAFTNVNDGDLAVAPQLQQVIDALSGVAGAGQPLAATTLDSDTTPALTLRNLGTGGALLVQKTDGSTVFSVNDSGFSLPTLVAPLRIGPTLGEWIDTNGWVGFLDSATGADLSATDTPFAVTHTTATNEVMADFQLHSSYPGLLGIVNSTGTVGAASTLSTINDLTKSWTVNQWTSGVSGVTGVPGGRTWFAVLTSGTGSPQSRLVVSNTATSFTVSPAFSGSIDTTTAYRIVAAGDMGAMRVLMEATNGNVASRRASEFHAYAQTGAADAGLQALEISVGSNATQSTPYNNVGISVSASNAWLTGNIGVEQGTAVRLYGPLGWTNYWTTQNAAGTFESYHRKGGHLEMAGTLTVGSVTAGTARVNVNQSADSTGNGVRVFPNGSTVHYGEMFIDGNKGLNLGVVQSGTGSAALIVSPNPSFATLTMSAPSTLTTSALAELYIAGNGTPRAKIDSAGEYYRQGTQMALRSTTAARNELIGQIMAITGDTRLIWLPQSTDTTTSLGESYVGATMTYDATIAARLTASGLGQLVSFSGSGQYATTPDNANFTFGTGAADSAFTVIVLANVTDTAALRTFLSKYTTSNTEWIYGITASDTLFLNVYDDSAGVGAGRASNAAITQGSLHLFAASYSGTGGATAANGIALYQDAVVVASTAINNGAYVAMEDKGAALEIGSHTAHTSAFMQGQLGLAIICAKALSVSEHWAIKKLVNGYFGLAL